MRRHLQAVLGILVTFIIVLVIVGGSVLYSAPNCLGVCANQIHAATL